MKDVDGDGRPELDSLRRQHAAVLSPDPANPTGTWVTTTISEPGLWGANIGHGMGIGDINGDGLDGLRGLVRVVGTASQGHRTRHALEIEPGRSSRRWGASQGGAGGAEMGIYDVNGDKLNDVVTALEGHGFGLAWHEQKRDASWKDHVRAAHDHGQRARQERG